MREKLVLFLSVFAVILSAQTFAADEDPNLGLIKARQGDMELRAYSVGPLFAMAKGEIPYDAEQATKLANNLKVLMQLDVGGAWAAGTGKDKYPGKTHAVPEVWSTYPKVAEAGKRLTEEMDDLVDEIDKVLEENAAEFVKNYVQKGGE